jgi:hypothetical protein
MIVLPQMTGANFIAAVPAALPLSTPAISRYLATHSSLAYDFEQIMW